MDFTFSIHDFEKIGAALGQEAQITERLIRYELRDAETGRRLSLEIQPAVNLEAAVPGLPPLSLVSVYATNAVLQLQGCTGYVASEELGEVIFFAKNNGLTNGLVVESGAGCSLYANVQDYLLSADFTQLPSEVMMSSIALSMTEDLFNDL